jgi:hypothetical protein
MGTHVVVSGEVFVAADRATAFLDAWGEFFSDDHQHTWACVATHLDGARVARSRDGAVRISISAWEDLDYRAENLLRHLAPHVAWGRVELSLEMEEERDVPWVFEIEEGRITCDS